MKVTQAKIISGLIGLAIAGIIISPTILFTKQSPILGQLVVQLLFSFFGLFVGLKVRDFTFKKMLNKDKK